MNKMKCRDRKCPRSQLGNNRAGFILRANRILRLTPYGAGGTASPGGIFLSELLLEEERKQDKKVIANTEHLQCAGH